jgi:dye decolorizing peroxidase
VAKATVPFFGRVQAGVETPQQRFASFVALNLRSGVGSEGVARLLRLWTSDISLLMAGRPAMGDAAPELADLPHRLTVTVGLGHAVFVAIAKPELYPLSIKDLPGYSIDALESKWSGGDFVLQICADDQFAISHAQNELIKGAKPFADVHWIQQGFVQHRPNGETPRNLMGQLDGTDNPQPNSKDFSSVVWNDGKDFEWFANGTVLAFRRIRMQLETWEKLSPGAQETVIGRNRTNGAPLTGTIEKDLPDFAAKKDGELVIAPDAHIRRASTGRNIFRRVFNYSDGVLSDGQADVGLLFAAYQAEVETFLEIQARLAESDALNRWTVPIGSGLFVILPGVQEGGWLGQSLFN